MGGSARGKRLVAEFRDAPIAAETVEYWLQCEGALEQSEVSIRSLEHRTCGGNPQSGQFARVQRGASVERDLHGQDRAALAVGLHGAADLRQLPGEGRFQRRAVEADQAPGRRDSAEAAGRSGAEEAKPSLRGEPQAGRDVNTHGYRRCRPATLRPPALPARPWP